MSLTKSDFYFGALISRLMKTGSAPAIVENGDKRRIYSIENNYGNFQVYTKYSSAHTTNRKRKDGTLLLPKMS